MEPEILSAEEVKETRAVAVVLTEALAITVEDQATMQVANNFFLRLRMAKKKIESVFEPHIERAKAAKNAAEAMRKGIVEEMERALVPINEAERVVKKEIQLYLDVQRELREKEEARMREQARKDEENRRLALAVEAEAAGQSKLAEAVLDRPMVPLRPSFFRRRRPRSRGRRWSLPGSTRSSTSARWSRHVSPGGSRWRRSSRTRRSSGRPSGRSSPDSTGMESGCRKCRISVPRGGRRWAKPDGSSGCSYRSRWDS